jgi:hypothetical protein
MPNNADVADPHDRRSLPSNDAQFVKYGKSLRRRSFAPVETRQMFDLNAESRKLRAALEYLGDRLSTHPASRFKPPARPLLEEWLARRRGAAHGIFLRADGGYRSWQTEERPPQFTIDEPYHAERDIGI